MNVEKRVAVYLAQSRRFTLWTFIKYNEKSKDPAHCRSVRKHMRAELERRHRKGEVIRCRSIKGGVAWKPAPQDGAPPF